MQSTCTNDRYIYLQGTTYCPKTRTVIDMRVIEICVRYAFYNWCFLEVAAPVYFWGFSAGNLQHFRKHVLLCEENYKFSQRSKRLIFVL